MEKTPKYIRGQYTEAHKESTIKYLAAHYDTINGLRVRKGEKEKIKAHAESEGKALTRYILDLIKSDMERAGKDINI